MFFIWIPQRHCCDKSIQFVFPQISVSKNPSPKHTMELSHSLTLNEEALLQIPEAQQPMFIFEWLRFLDKVLVAAQKVKCFVYY